jgi:signal transduction histidine kinase
MCCQNPKFSHFRAQPGRCTGEQGWREVAIRSKDGTESLCAFSAACCLKNEEMMGTVSFFQDLREIKRLEAELLRSERLAAIGQTVAGVAHGVKNILHGFKGGLPGRNRHRQKRYRQTEKGWDMIQRNIGRTSDLVLDLISYSKERNPECEICAPNAIVKDVCEVMQDLAEHITRSKRRTGSTIGLGFHRSADPASVLDQSDFQCDRCLPVR